MAHSEFHTRLQSFLDDGWIDGIGPILKSGKEATVLACPAGKRLPSHQWVAAKLYRKDRTFRDDARYHEGRIILSKRVARAVANRSEFGRRAKEAGWIAAEFYMMKDLAAHGLDVPTPITLSDSVMLMELIGGRDDNGNGDGTAAPPLAQVDFAPSEAAAAFNRILGNVDAMLHLNCVHGDLSPYNVLFDSAAQRPVIIDFPQAVDPRVNPHALSMLRHDVRMLAEFFEPMGVRGDFDRWVTDLWARWGGDGHHVALSAIQGRVEKISRFDSP